MRTAAATVLVLCSVAPFAWFAMASLKGPREIAQRPPTLVPREPTLEGYFGAAEKGVFGWMANSLIVAAATTFVTAQGGSLAVTCSIGVATYPSGGGDWDTLFKATDEALYASKRSGRDRVTLWSPRLRTAKAS